MCLGAGFATQNTKPVVAIYSTFLQRAYDQVIHDVCVQSLDGTFAIDRAGLVGEDGPTHAGVYDYAYLRTLPEIIIAAPSSEAECRLLLSTCYQHQGPAAVRYPRGQGPGELPDASLKTVEVGRSLTRRKGQSGIVILGFGSRVFAALKVAEKLDATVVDMRWVKPLDEAILRQYADAKMVVTVEEHQRMGGAGSAASALDGRPKVPVAKEAWNEVLKLRTLFLGSRTSCRASCTRWWHVRYNCVSTFKSTTAYRESLKAPVSSALKMPVPRK